MFAAVTIGMFVILTFAVGLLLSFTPYLMRRNECFAVTVPPSAQQDGRFVALKRRYAKTMLVVTAVATVASLAAGALIVQGTTGPGAVAAGVGTALECAAVLVPTGVSFALMLRARRAVIEIKRAEGWAPSGQQSTAVVAEEDLPGAIPLAWNLLYVPVILGTLALGLALYPSMPDMLPMHADFAGNVTRYEPKTLGSAIGFPVLVELFMAACFVLCHWMILRSKRPSNPKAPSTSALAYGLFARAQSVFLLATGLLLSVGIGALFLLSSAGFIGLGQAGVAIMLLCVPVVIGAIVLSVVYGQAGSRVFKRMQGDDEHWKLGVFYFNPDDASAFLPERFGIGWTMNFARPAAWVVLLGGAVLTVGFVVAIVLLA